MGTERESNSKGCVDAYIHSANIFRVPTVCQMLEYTHWELSWVRDADTETPGQGVSQEAKLGSSILRG